MTFSLHLRPFDLQHGVATLKQLDAAGFTMSQVRAQLNARRWQRCGNHCVILHNSVPTRAQLTWVAVLDQPQPAALAGLTSLQEKGFRFFGAELELIHIVVVRGAPIHSFSGVKTHESRRFSASDIDATSAIPRTMSPRSALDAAAWQPFPRYASALLAAVVQQRICSADELSSQLKTIGRIRHKAHLRLALADISGGAEALSEIDLAVLCREYGLVAPDRQTVRRDKRGRRRYLDAEWILADGTIIVMEIDGAHHMAVAEWDADVKRERRVVITGRRVLRATAMEVRLDPADIAEDLRLIGVPHR